MNGEDAVDEGRTVAEARDHAWDWWKYHADQRIALIRFYILSLGGIAVAIGWLYQQHQIYFCVLLSVFGAMLSFCFLRLDTRTADLVKIDENALRGEESRLAVLSNNIKLNLCEAADKQMRYWPYTYGQIISVILSMTMILVVFAAVLISAR